MEGEEWEEEEWEEMAGGGVDEEDCCLSFMHITIFLSIQTAS